MRAYKKPLAIFVLVLIFIGAAYFASPVRRTNVRVDSLIKQLDREIAKAPSGLTSNPYDYARSSPAFHQFSLLHRDAIPVLAARIGRSRQNGLREYLWALAAENLRSDNGAKDRISFSSAGDWLQQYYQHQ